MDEHSARGGATLPGGSDGAEKDAGDCDGEIGRRGDDHRVVSAELEEGFSESGGDFLADGLAHPGGAGGGDKRNSGVFDHLLALLSGANDDLGKVGGGVAELFAGLLKK